MTEVFPANDLAPEVVSLAVVEELLSELSQAAQAYYQEGEDSLLTDAEFDQKLEYLQTLAGQGHHEELFAPGTPGFLLLEGDPALGSKVTAEAIIEHKIPMLSLGKAKKEPELTAFLTKTAEAGATSFKLQAKLDGLALAVRYRGGKLTTIATRGDGVHGEDVTYLTEDPAVTLAGLPLEVSDTTDLEVRGELFFTREQFKAADDERFAITGERFKNSRNSASGLLKKAKLGVGYPVTFTFSSYSVLRNGAYDELATLEEFGFVTVDGLTQAAVGELQVQGLALADVLASVESFGKLRPAFAFPTDGVVIKPANEVELHNKLGFTSHHPVSQVAWKYPAEKATTEVIGIDLTVGKSGKVTPIARVKPAELDGSILQNASLHNFNLVYTKDIRVGSVVLIEKSNDIIPQVVAVLSHAEGSELMPVPTHCPACAEELTYDKEEGVWPPKTLRCGNVECVSRNFFALKTAVGKNYMDIDMLAEGTLEFLHSIGRVNTIADLYTLTEKELADSTLGESSKGTPRRLGEKRAAHILNYLEKSKTRPLTKMLPALSIDLLGRTSTRELEKHFGDIDGILAASREDIAALEGFGPIKAAKIHAGLLRRAKLIEELREAGVTFGKTESALTVDAPVLGKLAGLAFAISGAVPEPFANRGAWVDFVEAEGGVFHSGPKADTSFMVGDPTDTSSKIKKAHSLGLDFLTAEEFTTRFAS